MTTNIPRRTLSDLIRASIRPISTGRKLTAARINCASGEWRTAAAQGVGRLLCPYDGILVVRGETGISIASKQQAIWLPPACGALDTRMLCGSQVDVVTIPLDVLDDLPTASCVLGLSNLLREVVASASLPSPNVIDLHQGVFVRDLLNKELRRSPVRHLTLPWPTDTRLRSVCSMLTKNTDDATTAEMWAKQLGISPKTVHLLFRQQTGLTFIKWRQGCRLISAIEGLAVGRTIKSVAKGSGYSNPSGFAAVFRQHFGVSPSVFMRSARRP